ncbi:hypothetical protein BDV38DRAFT_237322 [Aspergillus pseudotamarii]|uniref:Uncharacterized protein n=1 Tax=Aspergillus pseudotamarii TaxID=132259 RepID=A0A5N6T5U4_ASPPS|nr:uncharacterized protein BDV38DRAFT_237322 [Aspergillus pseudotamarii]KAE8141678.1 hypothetical protein BDV38DRAFT_237322 [Aspergillus pseudotamarii]
MWDLRSTSAKHQHHSSNHYPFHIATLNVELLNIIRRTHFDRMSGNPLTTPKLHDGRLVVACVTTTNPGY